VLGRDTALIITLLIASISALCSSILPMGSAEQVYITIIVCRFVLGIGVGGVYPLSATKASEDGGNGEKVDSRAASLAFFWQVPGMVTPWFLGFLLTFGNISSDIYWRIILGFGFIPGILVVIGS